MSERREVARWDEELVGLCRREAALRLRLGQVLELIGRGAYLELGFSSLSAYVLERCERGVRWAEAARCLARRLEDLPGSRRALAAGEISWSMGEMVGRVATPATESAWLEAAQGCTVRELRALVRALLPSEESALESEAEEERCTLSCTVDREEAWLFEATRTLLAQLGARGTEEQVEALLAEAQESLLAALPRGACELPDLGAADAARRKWREQLASWRAEVEVRCDRQRGERARMSESSSASVPFGAQSLASFASLTASELDAEVRQSCRSLASQELELSRCLLRFHRMDGWRRAGYATETHYARERLGMSRSSLLARRALALRLEALPRAADELGSGMIGVEAALQIVRVATPRTEGAWLERAKQRTVKHLRQEVSAALVAVRLSGEVDCWPPADSEIDAFQELERAVVSGRACERPATVEGRAGGGQANGGAAANDAIEGRAACEEAAACEERRVWRVMLSSLQAWLARGVQMSAGVERGGVSRTLASAGRVELRLRVSRSTYDWWRGLEACARRWLPRGVSWVSFICRSVWRGWRHLLGADVAYGGVYVRDRFCCTSPVCSRRDVTPHHVRFRSAGGSDDDCNVVAVCTCCHLFGIHGGRIRASGTADHLRWELGSAAEPCLIVDGRDRIAA